MPCCWVPDDEGDVVSNAELFVKLRRGARAFDIDVEGQQGGHEMVLRHSRVAIKQVVKLRVAKDVHNLTRTTG